MSINVGWVSFSFLEIKILYEKIIFFIILSLHLNYCIFFNLLSFLQFLPSLQGSVS